MYSCRLPRMVARHIHARRAVSTLSINKHIYAFPSRGSSHILSLLPSDPPSERLAIGTTTALPPTPDSFSENPRFLEIIQSVLAQHAIEDPEVQAQAQAFVTTAGSQFGTGGAIFNQRRSGKAQSGGDGADSGSRGGFVHISDTRCPPDYGRIAWPEDIFGSLQVNANGELDGADGGYQPSGTYRILTREGILGLSDYLRGKVVERLREEEKLQKR